MWTLKELIIRKLFSKCSKFLVIQAIDREADHPAVTYNLRLDWYWTDAYWQPVS